MNNIENIEIFVEHNWDNLSDEFKSDWAALAKQRNKDTGEVDQDLLNAFIKKHKTDFMHNQGGEIVDLNTGKSLIERMQADNVDFSDTSSVYDQNLARKYNVADPNTVREARAKLQQAKEYQEGRARRKKEIENAGFFSPWTLASEYSKQRYIDNPDASMFGKEGNYFTFSPTNFFNDKPVFEGGILSSEGQSDLRDVLLGGAGAVGDAIPGIGGIVVGPAVRAGRDVYHKAVDDKYQKDWDDIAFDTGTDLIFNAGTDWLPTAILNRTSKMGKGGTKTVGGKIADAAYDASKIIELDKADKELFESLDKLGARGISNAGNAAVNLLDQREIQKKIARLPESSLKTELLHAKSWDDQLKTLIKYNLALEKKYGAHEIFGPLGGYNKENFNAAVKTYGRNMANRAKEREIYKDPDNLTKIMVGLSKGFEQGGGAVVKEGATAKGRGSKPVETLDAKHKRWSKGFATTEEQKTDEYKTWYDANIKNLGR